MFSGLQWRLYLKLCVCDCVCVHLCVCLQATLQIISVWQKCCCVDRARLVAFCPHIVDLNVSGSCDRTLISSVTYWPYVCVVVVQPSVWANVSVCVCVCVCVRACPVVLTLCFCVCVHGESPSSLPERVWLSLSLVCLPTNQIWRVMETHGCPGRKVTLRNGSQTHRQDFFHAVAYSKESVGACFSRTEQFPLICSRGTGQTSCFSLCCKHPDLPLREVRGDGIVVKRQHLQIITYDSTICLWWEAYLCQRRTILKPPCCFFNNINMAK